MSDTTAEIGALEIPVPQPENNEPIADPALSLIAGFIAQVFRRCAADAWAMVAPKEPIIRRTFTHDPQEYSFSEKDLPALYAFRVGSARATEQIAEDFRIRYDNVRVFWVLPNMHQEIQIRRVPVFHALAGALDNALYHGRDPGWVVKGDPDPLAQSQGSILIRHAGLKAIRLAEWADTKLAIQIRESEALLFDALSMRLELEEQMLLTYADVARPAGLDLKVNVEGFEASHHISP